MELRQLRYFVTVASELNFGRAAERLHMTQPALSKQIAALEKELSVQLFTRTKRTVNLTVAGLVFWEKASQLLHQVDEAVQLTKLTARGEAGRLNIGFTPTATRTVLPKLVQIFRLRFPNVELNMRELCTEAQVSALNHQQIDIGFLHPPIDERSLKLIRIFSENFVAVLPKNHHLLKYEKIPLSAFVDEPLIVHPRKQGPILYDGLIHVCQQFGFQPKIVHESTEMQTRVCLVAAGIGISFVSESTQSLVGTDVACRALENCPIKLEFAAAWRQDSSVPTLREFLAVLILFQDEQLPKTV